MACTPPRSNTLRRCLRLRLPSAAALLALSGIAFAVDLRDPFATQALAPPPLLATSDGSSASAPCSLPAELVVGVIEAVDLALCRNPETHAVWAQARAQAAQVGVAQSDFLPTLDGRAQASRLRGDGKGTSQRSAALTLSWLLYDFGARSANLEAARQLLSAASATLEASVQSVFLAALQAYYNAQAARAAVAAAMEAERASRETLSAAEVRYQVGSGTPADRLQARTAWSQAALSRIRAEGALRTAFGRLAKVIGVDANQPLRLDDVPSAPPEAAIGEREVAALIAEARARRPELRAAEAQWRAAQATVEATRALGWPTISFDAGPQWQQSDGITTHSSSLGLTLSVPIFSGFHTTYSVRAAQAKSEAQAAQRDNVHQQVALDVWEAYQTLITATQSIRTTADLLASAEHSERVTLGRYRAGVGNILDLLNAQSALAAARVQRIQATLDWYVSRAALARAIGTLDHSLLLSAAREPKAQR